MSVVVGRPELTYGAGLLPMLKYAGVNADRWMDLAQERGSCIDVVREIQEKTGLLQPCSVLVERSDAPKDQ